MAKKCIPGVFCIENMTLFLLVVLCVFVGHMYFQQQRKSEVEKKEVIVLSSPIQSSNVPPMKIESKRDYNQMGILTRENGGEILPLMGRRLKNDKMQYYTVTESGIKIPVSRGGRSCTGEYGCDEAYNGDSLFAQGFNDTFKTTLYESGQFSYNPNSY